jgi:hypothetical protein
MACPRPEVVAMDGLYPVVFLAFPYYDRNLSGKIIRWEPLREEPCLVVRVVLDTGSGGEGKDESQLWSANVSESHAVALSADRQASLRRSQEGRAWRGRSWQEEQ